MVDKVKVLARDLRNGKLQLRSAVPIDELERRRQHKLRQLYLEEKSEKEQHHQITREQHQITNQDVARMALARRKELERLREEEQRKEEKRLEEQRAELRRAEERRAEQRRVEQRRAEQRREEQRRAEQRRAEQRRAEQRKAEQRREEQRRAERRAEEQMTEQQRPVEQRRSERRVEGQITEQQRAEERREEERRAERRVEEQMAEQRRAEERRAEERRLERRIEEQRAELRRAEEHRAELRRAEQRRAEERREEERRAEEQRRLELEEAKAAELPKNHQQLIAAEELLRRVTGDTSTSVKFGAVKRQSVLVDESAKTPTNKASTMSHWYNSSSSGVPLRNSTHVHSNEQWRRSASSNQPRPRSMEILDFSTPQQVPHHHREGPIGGYPSPPRHRAPPPPPPHSTNPTRHQTRFTGTDKAPNHRAHTQGHHMTAVVHPSIPQTHHNQLDNGFLSKDQHNWNNYPATKPSPPMRREAYKTSYRNTEHGPTLYSMV